jgi:acyl-CoA synthetase (AMP-forming)/AMP-acid ligase II
LFRYGTGKYLRTGDMAFMVDDRVYYSGRIKDMIIVRGQNFYAQARSWQALCVCLCHRWIGALCHV